ncbi:MAG: NRDE family protein [Planctomycetaceae bacterium]|nr:NRDE family protein [Planctomycetaceae bacterium]
MGILAIHYQSATDSPILLALNREERFNRPSIPPRIQSGRPRVVCGIDRKAGGTWAGVNQHGLFAAVINCPKRSVPPEPRSRGLLCRELLACKTAEEALEKAYHELQTGCYAGGNFFCVDRQTGGAVYGGDEIEVEKLWPGLHILSSKRLNDRHDTRQEFVRRLLTLQRIDTSVSFLAVASRTFSRKPDDTGKRGIVIIEPDYGTVSSLLLSLSERTQRSHMQYATGSPSEKPYEDVSALLRQVLSTDRS